jgi:bifunctional non-homologous end joining protein LigD
VKILEQTSLAYKDGSSDKVYHAQLNETDTGFTVTIQYGRRGATLQTGTKTAAPTTLEKARSAYEKVVKEKLAKGYTPGESGTPYAGTETAARVSGQLPQLLNAIDEGELKRCLDDNQIGAQEKHDGVRLLLKVTANDVVGINRKGLSIALPVHITLVASTMRDVTGGNDFFLDGELVGDTYYVFDLLEHGTDMRSLGFSDRYDELTRLFDLTESAQKLNQHIRLSTLYLGNEKRKLFEHGRESGHEGIVLRNLLAPYSVGRPHSGGPALKYKYYATATVEIAAVNAKRSVAMRVYDDAGKPRDIGNVTIPPNFAIPSVGAIAEVRYLYAYPGDGGCLYQPVYLGERQDVEPSDCRVDELQFKSPAA